jgi:hypothetical protein
MKNGRKANHKGMPKFRSKWNRPARVAVTDPRIS